VPSWRAKQARDVNLGSLYLDDGQEILQQEGKGPVDTISGHKGDTIPHLKRQFPNTNGMLIQNTARGDQHGINSPFSSGAFSRWALFLDFYCPRFSLAMSSLFCH
jgi:hypothetical protein